MKFVEEKLSRGGGSEDEGRGIVRVSCDSLLEKALLLSSARRFRLTSSLKKPLSFSLRRGDC